MKNWHPIDPAEKWLAKKILDPSEYDIFLREPTFIRNKIKNRIFDEIRKLISKSRQTNPPFAPEKIAQYRKIKKIIWDEKLTYRESLLIPRGDGFIIKLNPKKSQVRLRFSCAHEIGHTYFFDLNTRPPQKFYSTSSSRYWVEEGYASEIAGEILLPEPYLSKTASKISKDPSLEALTQLRNDFNVSYEVLIKRLFRDSHLWNSNFWGNNLWDGIVITAEIKKTGTPQMKVYRSPKYRYKLKNITNNEKIKEVIHCALENGIAKDDVIKIRKNRYRIQCRVSRKWPKMTILIIYGET